VPYIYTATNSQSSDQHCVDSGDEKKREDTADDHQSAAQIWLFDDDYSHDETDSDTNENLFVPPEVPGQASCKQNDRGNFARFRRLELNRTKREPAR